MTTNRAKWRHTCDQCGTSFTARTPTARFCDSDCRNDYHTQQRRKDSTVRWHSALSFVMLRDPSGDFGTDARFSREEVERTAELGYWTPETVFGVQKGQRINSAYIVIGKKIAKVPDNEFENVCGIKKGARI